MSHFFLPSVFVARLRPENMAAVLFGCGGQSQTKCQINHIVEGIKAPSGAVCVQPRCTLEQYRCCKWRCAAQGKEYKCTFTLNSTTEREKAAKKIFYRALLLIPSKTITNKKFLLIWDAAIITMTVLLIRMNKWHTCHHMKTKRDFTLDKIMDF